MKRIILLHGAKKNIGDFLIFSRAKILLETFKPEYEIIPLEGWKKMDDKLDLLNSATAIVIGGGPGIQSDMYPDVYPLVQNLDDIQAPIYTLGSGWQGFANDDAAIYSFYFEKTAKKMLSKIKYFGVRDYTTMRILQNNGFDNISMNGCPAWYNLKKTGEPFRQPSKNEINNIVFTPPQKALYAKQSVAVMKLIREFFPNAIIYCSFQRGTSADQFTAREDAQNIKNLITESERFSFITKDTSYDLENINFYDNCDLHIGYRVHGHLYFLSNRIPSILLNEDARGAGTSEALGLSGVSAFERSLTDQLVSKVAPNYLQRKIRKILPPVYPNRFAIRNLRYMLDEGLKSNWRRHQNLHVTIDTQLKTMQHYIQHIIP